MAREWGNADWDRLLAERGDQLMGAAIALTGSREAGEDLLQAALERVLRKPRQVDQDMEGYRRVLYNLAADGWRRRGRWRQKVPLLRSEAMVAAADDTVAVDLRDVLVRLVLQLPPRQRAVVVLRYWEQRSEAETAGLLGCSEGTVRSAAARGLRRLRELACPSGGHRHTAVGGTVMTNGMEQLLREGFDRLTAGARAPTGMVRRARRRNRRRRIAALSAAGTALATAAVITVAVLPEGSPLPRVQTAAYVTSRAQHALVTVDQKKIIAEVRATGRNGAFGFTVLNLAATKQQHPAGSAVLPGVLGSVRAQRMTSWYYHGLSLQEGFSATGKLVFASSTGPVTSPAGKHVTEAYGAAYPVRTQWRSPITGGPNWSLPKLTCSHPIGRNMRATILKELSCKLLTVDGHQQVDGVTTIKLVMVKPLPGLRGETIWIDPATYLPVRTSTASPAPHGQASVLVQDYRWLPATRANLAALHAAIRRATIPPGFRTLPSNDLPVTGFTTP